MSCGYLKGEWEWEWVGVEKRVAEEVKDGGKVGEEEDLDKLNNSRRNKGREQKIL